MKIPYGISVSEIAVKIRDLLIIAGVVSAIISFGFGTYWAANKERFREEAREFIGVKELATKDQVAEIVKVLNQVTGADRIINIDPVFSWVKEPVKIGEDVTARYLVNRTLNGKHCLAQHAVPIFTDDRNVPLPGVLKSPITQFSTEPTTVELIYGPPENQVPGRVCVKVAVTYECNGKPRFDQIDHVCYILQS